LTPFSVFLLFLYSTSFDTFFYAFCSWKVEEFILCILVKVHMVKLNSAKQTTSHSLAQWNVPYIYIYIIFELQQFWLLLQYARPVIWCLHYERKTICYFLYLRSCTNYTLMEMGKK
jgi:hypothetical protein